MESFINKIKSTVSEVLSGNPLSGDYDIQDQPIGTAGPDLIWKIYRAQKKTTKEEASVFVFEKKTIEKLSKTEKNDVLTSLKRGVQQLTKLRHPKILSVLNPIEENREFLAFATEPVCMSLSNVLGDSNNISSYVKPADLDEVEIKYGVLQVLEALSFLHADVGLVHRNIHPSVILLNDKRVWKLSGFDFFVLIPSSTDQVNCTPWRSDQLEFLQPHLDYLAPESVLSSVCSTKSDIYSLGVLIHAVYNNSKPIYQSHNSISTCRNHVSEMKKLRQSVLRNIPDGWKEPLKSLLDVDPSVRPEAKFVAKIGHFDDISVLTLVYLDSLAQRDNLQKSQYFKNLPNVLRQLPLTICLYRVLPALYSECHNVDMVPFVLQNILVIADRVTKQQYNEHIFTKLVPLMKLKNPIQIPLMFLKHMTLLLSKTNERDSRAHILPMILQSIDLNNAAMQELCLNILPSFSHLIDKDVMKNAVVPRIRNLCLVTQYPNMKVKCLLCLGKMMNHMDKWFVLDEVLPFLSKVQTRDAAVLMTILGIYKTAFTHKDLGIPREQLATKALPFIISLSVDHSLSKQQFQLYMTVIKDMIGVLEKEQIAKFEEQSSNDVSDNKSLTFGDDKDGDDTMMMGFLRDAGLTDSTVPQTVTSKPLYKTETVQSKSSPSPQVKDLTSSLPAMSVPQTNKPSTPILTNQPVKLGNSTLVPKSADTKIQPKPNSGASWSIGTPPAGSIPSWSLKSQQQSVTTSIPPTNSLQSFNSTSGQLSRNTNLPNTSLNSQSYTKGTGSYLGNNAVTNSSSGWSAALTSTNHSGIDWTAASSQNSAGSNFGNTTNNGWSMPLTGGLNSTQGFGNSFGNNSSLLNPLTPAVGTSPQQTTGHKQLSQKDLNDLLG